MNSRPTMWALERLSTSRLDFIGKLGRCGEGLGHHVLMRRSFLAVHALWNAVSSSAKRPSAADYRKWATGSCQGWIDISHNVEPSAEAISSASLVAASPASESIPASTTTRFP